MCAFGTPSGCGLDEPNYATQCLPFYGRPCACLRLRLPSGELDDRGYVTFASSCAAYRGLFPDDVECMEPFAWTPLP